jgi:hypothetical protein
VRVSRAEAGASIQVWPYLPEEPARDPDGAGRREAVGHDLPVGWPEHDAQVDGLERELDIERVIAQAETPETASASAASRSLKLSAVASLIFGTVSAASGDAVPMGMTSTRAGGRLTAVA